MTEEQARSQEVHRRRIKAQMRDILAGRLSTEEEQEARRILRERGPSGLDCFVLRAALRRCFREDSGPENDRSDRDHDARSGIEWRDDCS